jgi:3-oxoacyl-[acyl-carrier protein] reductase
MSALPAGRLQGMTAIVTGAGQGIGEAVARLFAREGANVVVNSRTPSVVERIAASIRSDNARAVAVPADVGEIAGVRRLVDQALKHFAAIDILVHNAGIFPYQPLEQMEEGQWQEVLNVNLTSGFRLIRACVPAMKERGRGRIIFSSSVQGNRVAVPGCAHYAASKAGINGLIRAAALELAGLGITVNGVEPGLVLTAGTDRAISARRRADMAKYVPMKRWGQPLDVAHAMLYLASPEAAYVTGQTIVVDGGALLPQNGALMV